jgi:hypothetical protein
MDNSELLKNLHKRMMTKLFDKEGASNGVGNIKIILAKDQNLRKAIADFFLALNELNDPKLAVDMLAEHVAILVEMINQFKNPGNG